MAGKFLTLDEAAAALGISADDVQKLVDRKELFPIRDGGNLKFRGEEIERRKQDSSDAVSWEETAGADDDDLTVELGSEPLLASAITPEPAGGDLNLDEPLALDDLGFDDAPPAKGGDDLQVEAIELADDLALSGGDSLLGGSGADIDSIIASGAGGGGDATPPPAVKGSTDDLDLGDLELGDSGSLGDSANLGDSASIAASGESGLELGDGSLEISGIELSDVASGPPAGDGLELDAAISDVELSGDDLGGVELSADGIDGDLDSGSTDELDLGGGGDDFDLGEPLGDDESASQVVELSSESGEGSFFGDALDGAGSSFGDESGVESFSGSLVGADIITEPGVPEMRFTGLQIASLICMSLLMLLGGFMAYDLVRTIGSSDPVGNPVLDALAETIGWR
ncbi:MAG: helix-turn-helix domain-containing protein [Pirellulales bacterium]|nr:helix-turn-helix domain-containing protein [Pirellulales bacterium]